MDEKENKIEEIKEVIKDLVTFDIGGQLYNAEKKAEISKHFRKILMTSDIAIAAFLKELFPLMAKLAQDHDLLPTATEENGTDSEKEEEEELNDVGDEEAMETPEEETEEHAEGGEEENVEEPEEEVKAESVKHSKKLVKESVIVNMANCYLD
jgi:hypothetical protein